MSASGAIANGAGASSRSFSAATTRRLPAARMACLRMASSGSLAPRPRSASTLHTPTTATSTRRRWISASVCAPITAPTWAQYTPPSSTTRVLRKCPRLSAIWGLLVMMVAARPSSSWRANARLVVPASTSTVSPGCTLSASARASISLRASSASTRWPKLGTGCVRRIAPPCTRRKRPAASRSRRSLRIVSSDVLNRCASSAASTLPCCSTVSTMCCRRSSANCMCFSLMHALYTFTHEHAITNTNTYIRA